MNKDLLIRFINNQCTPEEELKVIRWMQSENFGQELMRYISDDLHQSYNVKTDLINKLNAIPHKIVSNNPEAQTKSDQPKRNILKVGLKVAASIIIIGVVGYIFSQLVTLPKLTMGNDTELVQEVTKANQRGQKSKIFLSDGTTIYLNSESTISYPSVFSDSIRIVALDGEAFFEVINDVDRPFIVKTEQVDIKVLGTSFNVWTERIAGKVKVTLVSGEVEVIDKNESIITKNRIILSPNQSILYNKSKGFLKPISNFNHLAEYGWKDGIIYFKNAALFEVIRTLEIWYNVDIKVTNKAPFAWSYNGTFKNESLQNVLKSIGYSQNFDFEVKDNSVEIKFNE